MRLQTPFLTPTHEKLKKLLISSLWSPLQENTRSIMKIRGLRDSLQLIASSLERLFAKKLEVVYRICKDPRSADKTIQPILRKSNIGECIRALEAWKETRESTSRRKTTPTTHVVDVHDDPNPRSIKHPAPVIDYRVLQGETSIHSRTELLFTFLHQNWPCRADGHGYQTHKGRLGHCKSAKFCIGPS